MKKVIIVITVLILCTAMFFTFTKGLECMSYDKIKKMKSKIKEVDEQITVVEKNNKKSNDEVDTLKEKNKDKVELLEVWEKLLKDVEKNLQ